MSGLSRSLRHVWKAYESQLAKNPITTQVATSTCLWGSGDVLSQLIEGQGKWNSTRTAYAAAFGGLLLGPIGHYWYKSLDRIVSNLVARGTSKFILTKVVLDEACFGPLHVLGFFTFMTKAEGGSWEDVQIKVKNDFLSTYLAELAIWPAYQTFNFAKIPVRHQLLVVNAGCLIDATFLCWVKNQEDWLATLGLRPATVKEDADQKTCRE